MPYRHELKFLINYADRALIASRLSALLRRDSHVNERGFYTVRSLYFDDYTNTAYNEKLSGGLDRQKFRMRIYNNSDALIQLERKTKRASYTDKQTTPITRRLAEDILCGDYDALLRSPDPLCQVYYHELRSKYLRPRVIIDYEREPFVMAAGTVRITFDMHVRAAMGAHGMFDPRLAAIELLEPGLLVMEVKYTEFLPSLVQRALPQRAADFTALSKYVLACDRTMHQRRTEI